MRDSPSANVNSSGPALSPWSSMPLMDTSAAPVPVFTRRGLLAWVTLPPGLKVRAASPPKPHAVNRQHVVHGGKEPVAVAEESQHSYGQVGFNVYLQSSRTGPPRLLQCLTSSKGTPQKTPSSSLQAYVVLWRTFYAAVAKIVKVQIPTFVKFLFCSSPSVLGPSIWEYIWIGEQSGE